MITDGLGLHHDEEGKSVFVVFLFLLLHCCCFCYICLISLFSLHETLYSSEGVASSGCISSLLSPFLAKNVISKNRSARGIHFVPSFDSACFIPAL
jgi:hypothetical protein